MKLTFNNLCACWINQNLKDVQLMDDEKQQLFCIFFIFFKQVVVVAPTNALDLELLTFFPSRMPHHTEFLRVELEKDR